VEEPEREGVGVEEEVTQRVGEREGETEVE